MTETATPTDTRPPRTQSRDARRLQVIEATIQSLADRGFSRTTITDVAERAGISLGLVLFHFQSKENLLAETLDYLAEEYRLNWQAALAEAGPAPEARCEDRVSRRARRSVIVGMWVFPLMCCNCSRTIADAHDRTHRPHQDRSPRHGPAGLAGTGCATLDQPGHDA